MIAPAFLATGTTRLVTAWTPGSGIAFCTEIERERDREKEIERKREIKRDRCFIEYLRIFRIGR